jgi:Tol biopolymer transport system component
MNGSKMTCSTIRGGLRSTLGAAAVANAAILLAEPAHARPRIPVMVQVTHLTTGTIEWPRIRSQEGSRIAFVSDGDVMGPGTETAVRQVYLYDVASGVTTQVTNDPTYPSYEAARPTDDQFAGGRPEIVAFISEADLDPSVGNADHNPEVFLWEFGSAQVHQLTNTLPPVVNGNPFPSDSGRCVVFDSNANLNQNNGTQDPTNNPGEGAGNPPLSNEDASREVFLYSLNSPNGYPQDGYYTQVSSGPTGTTSYRPVVGGYWFPRQCQSTVWMSDHDQVGGPRMGTHIFEFDRASGKRIDMVAPETPNGQPDGQYLNPMISAASPFARGPFAVFSTDADLWNNGSNGWNMFRYRIFHPRQTQYTKDVAGPVFNPVITDGGGLIAFESTGEPINPDSRIRDGQVPPFNADGNSEIFWQFGRNKMYQLTQTTGCQNDQPSVRDDGTSLTFRSSCDLIPGHNPGGVQQVFLYYQVKASSPEACVKPDRYGCECEVSEGCCNDANDCLDIIVGGVRDPNRKNCVERGNCPVD